LKRYIGGAGLAAYLYSQYVKEDIPRWTRGVRFHHDRPSHRTPVVLFGAARRCREVAADRILGESSVGGHWGGNFEGPGMTE